jgi:hypothetical protein
MKRGTTIMTTRNRVRIRKGGFWHELYLDRQGKWRSWENAAVFTNDAAADKFAAKYGITNYGLF